MVPNMAKCNHGPMGPFQAHTFLDASDLLASRSSSSLSWTATGSGVTSVEPYAAEVGMGVMDAAGRADEPRRVLRVPATQEVGISASGVEAVGQADLGE